MMMDEQIETRGRRRKQRDAEATQAAIVRAAVEEFAEKGFYGARVEEIAARTETSKHMIYYYFGSKDGLYTAVLEHAYAEFRSAEGADYASMEPVAALETLVGNSFDVHVAHPHVVRIVMSENLAFGGKVLQVNHASQRRLVIETIRGIIDRGVAQGVFRNDIDPLQLHMSVSALSFYFVSNRYTFGAIFELELTDEAFVAQRRAEVIRTMLARCTAVSAPQ